MAATTLPLIRSTIGKKAIMAVTGLIGYAFVIVHMVGNLKAFTGAEHFDAYAEFLRTVGEPVFPARTLLWVMRIVLLVAVVLHIWMAVSLSKQDLEARPVRYRQSKKVQASFASLTLRWGGIAIFLFLIYHLLHFTFGVPAVHPTFVRGAAYANMVAAFQNPLVVAVYVLAVAALGMHLYHGVWSMFQSLGLNGARTNGLWRGLAVISAAGLFLGFAVVPVAVLTGILR
ncbi:MAG TPA: succinate dehydrogenase cytochrome b subunit [Roseiflexaceae bacterium]|nr:succinate dehydrogenase cytochrome b subunit [Roseiflexaceae bacterium]